MPILLLIVRGDHMKLSLYNNYSELNKVDKNIVKIVDLEGSLLEATSLVNPVVRIFFKPEDFPGYVVEDNNVFITFNGMKITWDSFMNDYVLTANYTYIPDFNRYYIINDIVSYRTNLWYIHLHVDVLMSYKKQIRKLDAFVARNEFRYNKLVKDDLVSFYYDKEITEVDLEKGDLVNTIFESSHQGLGNPKSFLITCIADNFTVLGGDALPPTPSLPIVDNLHTGQTLTYKVWCTYDIAIARLERALIADQDLMGFLLSVVAFPFEIPYDSQNEYHLRLGSTDLDGLSGVTVFEPTPRISKYYVIADFTITGDSFLDYEPYTDYQLWIPYLSWISLSASDLLNNRIIVYYVIDFQSGSAQVTVYDVTNSKNLFTSNCQLGVKIGFTTTNAKQVHDNEINNNIGLGIGLLTSVVSIAGGAVTGNAVAVAGGVISGGKTIAQYVQNHNTNYSRASGSVGTANGGAYMSQEVRLRKTVLKPKNYDDNYAKLVGKPLNEYIKLGDLTGYTVVGDCHVENIASATSSEYNEIKSLLESGIIL